ncbi:MAG: TcpQ domain-containing protein [Rouxiella aceris]|uniref:PFGI-1 class ICE element type IV pilus protein PilL2 n=1 Tax=Rouxiella aceris TaxID=2703884 RepID=UPI002841E603|nr:TcpQ domain-containing protein [Rouxiella aceris]MDR3430718.1 TcpQ domain-containing protein [Rouxiella aceris]
MAQLTLYPGHKLAWLTLSLLTTGCTNSGAQSDALPRLATSPRVSDIYQNRSPEVVRYDRYTLVSTRPADAQRDPLNQMVEITMPAQLVRSVGDGFRYLLLESGYSLCPVSSSVFAELLSRPLPAVQRSIGPVRLSEALQILAGPAWRLHVDDVNREVCFTLRDAYRDFAPKVMTPVLASNTNTTPVAPRQSGNPFSASSSVASKVNSTSLLLPSSATVPAKPVQKSENVPVPSPVLTVVKSGSTPAATTSRLVKSDIPAISPKQATPSFVKPAPPVPAIPTHTPTPVPVNPSLAPTLLKTAGATTPPPPILVPTHPVFTPGSPVPVAPIGPLWRAEVGTTLKETLTRWAGEAKCDNGGNWVVIWPISLDYRIDAPLSFHGNFESVLVQVFDLYRQADKPLYAAASRMQCLVSVSDQPGRN